MKRNVKNVNEMLEKSTFPLYNNSKETSYYSGGKSMNQYSNMLQETKQFARLLQSHPEELFTLLRSQISLTVGAFLSFLMNQELTDFLGRNKYEHKPSKGDSSSQKNYRNGTYERSFSVKRVGKVCVRIPRDRLNQFKTKVIPRYQRLEPELRQDICLLYLSGISTRTLSLLSKRLLGRAISHTQVSRCHRDLQEAVEKWRTRSLLGEIYKYLFIDGVTFLMRIKNTI